MHTDINDDAVMATGHIYLHEEDATRLCSVFMHFHDTGLRFGFVSGALEGKVTESSTWRDRGVCTVSKQFKDDCSTHL